MTGRPWMMGCDVNHPSRISQYFLSFCDVISCNSCKRMYRLCTQQALHCYKFFILKCYFSINTQGGKMSPKKFSLNLLCGHTFLHRFRLNMNQGTPLHGWFANPPPPHHKLRLVEVLVFFRQIKYTLSRVSNIFVLSKIDEGSRGKGAK